MSDLVNPKLRKKTEKYLDKPPVSPPGGDKSNPRRSKLLSRGDGTSPDKPCHTAQDSLFSSSSGYTNYRGFFNLSLILLTLSNVRVALENIIKYGILIDPILIASNFAIHPYQSPIFWLIIGLNGFILPCVLVEKGLACGKLTDKHARFFYIVNIASVLIVPAVVIFWLKPNPFAACFCLAFFTVTFFKLISYAHVNYWCRLDFREKQKTTKKSSSSISSSEKEPISGDQQPKSRDQEEKIKENDLLIKYPQNLTVQNLYYFILAPTLCYELNFPRSFKIRKWFIAKRLFEFVFIFQAVLALCQQWIVPLLKNSLEPFIEMNYGRMLERLLKLAVPNHVVWLLSFYWLFHALLNLLAELLRFADRQFYSDWWNAENIQYFWQNWNIPVHRWAVRHLYLPLINSGFSKMQAGCMVFLISAFFHEYLLSIPLHLFRVWAFVGMLAQIPLNIITSRFIKGRAGNIVVWLSLILGQPLAILMYVHDWYVVNYMQQSAAAANSTGTTS